MRKTPILSLMALPLLLGTAFAAMTETIPEEVTTDMYFSDSVYLRNVVYPTDLSAEEGDTTAEVTGSGTVVVGDKKKGGFPRIVIPGDTVVTSSRIFGTAQVPDWWEGEITVPRAITSPQTSEVAFVEEGAHRASRIQIQDSFQLGLSNEWFTFSGDIYMIFDLGLKDGVKVWVAEDTDSGELGVNYEIQEEDFCVTQDGLCTIKLSTDINKMIFVTESYLDCPAERVENGDYGPLPDCAIVCESGFILDYENSRCVRSLEEEEGSEDAFIFRPEFTQRINDTVYARQGYFRYRDSRGSQLGALDATGLVGDEKDLVERKNVSNSDRVNSAGETGAQTVGEKNLWDAIKDLQFDLWLESQRNKSETHSDQASVSSPEGGEDMMMEGELAGGTEGSGQSLGGILPRTGPGMFMGIAVIGVALMAFATRKR